MSNFKVLKVTDKVKCSDVAEQLQNTLPHILVTYVYMYLKKLRSFIFSCSLPIITIPILRTYASTDLCSYSSRPTDLRNYGTSPLLLFPSHGPTKLRVSAAPTLPVLRTYETTVRLRSYSSHPTDLRNYRSRPLVLFPSHGPTKLRVSAAPTLPVLRTVLHFYISGTLSILRS